MNAYKSAIQPCFSRRRGVLLRLAFMLAFLSSAAVAWSAEEEVEPNDSCATSQIVNTSLPFEIAGELGVNVADIDFYQVSAPAGELVQIDLQGAYSGMGSLTDPYLGVFEVGSCQLTHVNDDSGFGSDSRLWVTMPESGVIVVGATQFPDIGFTDGGFGTYVLAFQRVGLIGSINAQLVDAETTLPLSGNTAPYAGGFLLRCTDEAGCNESVAWQTADDEGRLRFERDFYGNQLAVGMYTMQAFASGYDVTFTPQIVVAEDEHFDMGVVALTGFQRVGDVSGRLVDAITGQPLPGNAEPFGQVLLEQCVDSVYCYGVAFVYPDEQGHFSVNGSNYGLAPGDYRVRGFANNYIEGTSAIFAIGNRENFDFGDVGIEPIPVRLTNVTGCDLPVGGGTCSFGADVVNVGSVGYRGEAWATIDYYAGNVSSRFQVGRLGASKPYPIKVKLKAGQSSNLSFELSLPSSVPDGAFACATIWLGESPDAQLNITAQQLVFCVWKTSAGLSTMESRAAQKLLQKLKKDKVSVNELSSVGQRSRR